MLWIILFPAIVIGLTVRWRLKNAADSEDWFQILLFGPLISGVVGLLVATCVGATFSSPPIDEEWSHVETLSLTSLKSGSGTEGSTLLGTGYVAGVDYYIFYYRVDSSGSTRKEYRFSKIPIRDNVTLIEEEGSLGELKKYERKVGTRYISPWFGISPSSTRQVRYEFVIPPGSVKREFSAN